MPRSLKQTEENFSLSEDMKLDGSSRQSRIQNLLWKPSENKDNRYIWDKEVSEMQTLFGTNVENMKIYFTSNSEKYRQ